MQTKKVFDAEQFHILSLKKPDSNIDRKLKKNGKRKQKSYPNSFKQKAIALFEAGYSKSQVSSRLNVPESTSRGWIKSHQEAVRKRSVKKRKSTIPQKSAPVTVDKEAIEEMQGIRENLEMLHNLGMKFLNISAPTNKFIVNHVLCFLK